MKHPSELKCCRNLSCTRNDQYMRYICCLSDFSTSSCMYWFWNKIKETSVWDETARCSQKNSLHPKILFVAQQDSNLNNIFHLRLPSNCWIITDVKLVLKQHISVKTMIMFIIPDEIFCCKGYLYSSQNYSLWKFLRKNICFHTLLSGVITISYALQHPWFVLLYSEMYIKTL